MSDAMNQLFRCALVAEEVGERKHVYSWRGRSENSQHRNVEGDGFCHDRTASGVEISG